MHTFCSVSHFNELLGISLADLFGSSINAAASRIQHSRKLAPTDGLCPISHYSHCLVVSTDFEAKILEPRIK